MDIPKPQPPKRPLKPNVGDNSRKQKTKPQRPNIAWLVELPNKGTATVWADSEESAHEAAKKKFKKEPIKVEKKPYSRSEHLTDRPFKDIKKLLGK